MTDNYIITVGIQGPPGPTDFGKARVSRIAGESLAAYIVVAVGSDGKVYRASKSTPGNISRVLGITLAAVTINTAVDIHLFGEVTNGLWTFDTTKLIYLGDDGALTQSAPTAGFVLVLGIPTSASSFFVIPGVCAILASAGAGDAGRVPALDGVGKLALSFLPATLTGKDADTVDGYHAGNTAGKMPVLDGSALLPLAQVPATLTGKDADTVDGFHVSSLAKSGNNSDITSLLASAVGVGTVLPDSKLDVFSENSAISLRIGNNAGVGDASVDFYGVNGNAKPVYARIVMKVVDGSIGAESGDLTLSAISSGTLAERMRLSAGGNVGIGKVSPAAPLHILRASGANTVVELLRLDPGEAAQSTGAGSKITFRDVDVYTDTATIEAQRQADTSASTLSFRLRNATVPQFAIASQGNVGIGTQNQFGGGVGVVAIKDAVTVPSSNPSGGIVLYVDPADGKIKYRSASGEIRTLSYTT